MPRPIVSTFGPAHFPLWAIVAMVAATVILSIATTLITLSLEHMRQARHTPAAAAETQARAPSPSTTPQPEAGQGEILASQAAKVAFLFDQLKVTGTADVLARYIPNGPEWHRPAPEALKASVGAS